MNILTQGILRAAVLLAAALAPAMPAQARALDADPFWVPSWFQGGQYNPDAFAGSFEHSYAAYAGAQTSDDSGDVVVVGLVPQAGGGASTNLGLVRYGPPGVRSGFQNATPPYGHNANQYLIYPNSTASIFTAVWAVRIHEGRIYVLADRAFGGVDSDVHVVVFSQTGQFLSDTNAFGSGADERGGGLEVWNDGGAVRVGVVATRTIQGVSQPQFRRYLVQPNGTLNADGLVQTYTTTPCDIQSCFVTSTTFAPTAGRIYIGGSVQHNGDDYDYLVMAIDKQGALDPSFHVSGTRVVTFDQPDSNQRDWMTRIHVHEEIVGGTNTQQIVMVGEVSRRCRTGIGVVKMTGGGVLAPGFGIGGQVIVGGSDAAPGVSCNFAAAELARAVRVNHKRILIGGMTVFTPPCPIGQTCEAGVDSRIVSLHRQTGQVTEMRPFVAPIGGQQREFHSAIWDLVPERFDESGNHHMAVGDLRFPQEAPPNLAGKKMFSTLRLESDRIFGNGLQLP